MIAGRGSPLESKIAEGEQTETHFSIERACVCVGVFVCELCNDYPEVTQYLTPNSQTDPRRLQDSICNTGISNNHEQLIHHNTNTHTQSQTMYVQQHDTMISRDILARHVLKPAKVLSLPLTLNSQLSPLISLVCSQMIHRGQ